MIDISVNGIKKSFEIGNNILDGITFQVETGERVGLLGRNGAGKSTLFRILTGELEPDEGEVVIPRGRRLGLISQIPVFPVGYTVEDVLNTAFSRHQKLAAEMEALAAAMAAGDSSEATLRRYGELSAKFEGIGGYDTATAVGKVANGLGISQAMREQLFDSLSGGEKTRVNLGRLILEDTDILLLDEPTNHLDLHAVEWLEDYVRRFKGTVVAISHDRYFLDRTISRVIEICDGKAEFYSGNYTFYAIEKERRYQEKLRQYEKEQAKIRQLQEAADKLHLWAFMATTSSTSGPFPWSGASSASARRRSPPRPGPSPPGSASGSLPGTRCWRSTTWASPSGRKRCFTAWRPWWRGASASPLSGTTAPASPPS